MKEYKAINVYNNDKTLTLGEKPVDNTQNDQISSNPEGNPFNYCRTYTFELVPGVDQDAVSNEISNSPDKYLPKAIMRYGLIHSQLVNIIIPCNARLTVGECIRLNFENITNLASTSKFKKLFL